MKYFIIALLITSSLNAMRFDEQKAEETARVITITLGPKTTSNPDKKEDHPPKKQEKSGQNIPKAKL